MELRHKPTRSESWHPYNEPAEAYETKSFEEAFIYHCKMVSKSTPPVLLLASVGS